jgi:hypothetical protein
VTCANCRAPFAAPKDDPGNICLDCAIAIQDAAVTGDALRWVESAHRLPEPGVRVALCETDARRGPIAYAVGALAGGLGGRRWRVGATDYTVTRFDWWAPLTGPLAPAAEEQP